MVALGSISMIIFPLSSSELESDLESAYFSLSLVINDYLE